MRDLTIEDFVLASKIVEDIIENTDVPQIKEKIEKSLEGYEGNRRRQLLVHLNTLFLCVIVNELDWRRDEAYDRGNQARLVTKELNGR